MTLTGEEQRLLRQDNGSVNGLAVHVLWVSAQPDPRSLNGALREHVHKVVESHLHAMGWNPVVDNEDFAPDRAERT